MCGDKDYYFFFSFHRLWDVHGSGPLKTGSQAQDECPDLEADSGMGATVGVRLYQPELEDWPAFTSLLGTELSRLVWLGMRVGKVFKRIFC